MNLSDGRKCMKQADTQGLLCGIKRTAVHDGDGLRTTVFFKGCPLKCVWCHNPESIAFAPQVGFFPQLCVACGECSTACPQKAITLEEKPVVNADLCNGCGSCAEYCPTAARVGYGQHWSVERLAEKLLQDRRFYENSGGGVTLSGGECLAQSDFAVALAQRLSREGVRVAVDTCGFVPRQVLERIAPYTDIFLYDIKAIDPVVHKRCTGQENRIILDNLRFLCANGSRVEIRYPYVPGWNDGECEAIGSFLSGLSGITKVKVLGYHSHAKGKYGALGLPDTLPEVTVTAQDVCKPVEMLRRWGLNAVNGMTED